MVYLDLQETPSLHHPLQTFLLPHLSIQALGRLACTCTSLRKVVAEAPDEFWQAAASSKLPPLTPLQGCTGHAVRQLLRSYSEATHNIFSGRLVAHKEVDGPCAGWASFSPDASSFLTAFDLDRIYVVIVDTDATMQVTAPAAAVAAALPNPMSDEDTILELGWVAGGQQVRVLFPVWVEQEEEEETGVQCLTFDVSGGAATCTESQMIPTPFWNQCYNLAISPGGRYVWGAGEISQRLAAEGRSSIVGAAVIDLQTGEVVLQQLSQYGGQAWSQDDKHVAVFSYRNPDCRGELRVYSLEDRTALLRLPSEPPNSYEWCGEFIMTEMLDNILIFDVGGKVLMDEPKPNTATTRLSSSGARLATFTPQAGRSRATFERGVWMIDDVVRKRVPLFDCILREDVRKECLLDRYHLAWSPKDKFVAAWVKGEGNRGTIHIFETLIGSSLWASEEFEGRGVLQWLPHGRSLAAVSQGTLHIYNFST